MCTVKNAVGLRVMRLRIWLVVMGGVIWMQKVLLERIALNTVACAANAEPLNGGIYTSVRSSRSIEP